MLFRLFLFLLTTVFTKMTSSIFTKGVNLHMSLNIKHKTHTTPLALPLAKWYRGSCLMATLCTIHYTGDFKKGTCNKIKEVKHCQTMGTVGESLKWRVTFHSWEERKRREVTYAKNDYFLPEILKERISERMQLRQVNLSRILTLKIEAFLSS